MTQTTVLAAGQTAAESSEITLSAGAVVTVGIFGSAKIPAEVTLRVVVVTPGLAQTVATLSESSSVTALTGPGTFKVVRPDITSYGVNVGVFTND